MKDEMKTGRNDETTNRGNETGVVPAGGPPALPGVAEALSAQYARAIAGTREILIFGAMMNQLGGVLSRQNTPGAYQPGTGLKGWLSENCPEIHYKTAYGFLKLARAVVEELGVPEGTDVARLLRAGREELSEGEAEWRERIDGAVEGKSKRQLEFDFGLRKAGGGWGGKREGAGRPALLPEGGAVPDGLHRAAAEAWGDIARQANRFLAKKFDLALNLKETTVALESAGALVAALERRKKELESRP